jgi:hypothetical protein
LIVGLAAYPQIAMAEGFTGEQFLKWERASQDSLIQISITMTGIVSGRKDKVISQCIDRWYVSSVDIRRKRHDFILRTISENPTFHPQGVILAVLEEQCGSIKNQP